MLFTQVSFSLCPYLRTPGGWCMADGGFMAIRAGCGSRKPLLAAASTARGRRASKVSVERICPSCSSQKATSLLTGSSPQDSLPSHWRHASSNAVCPDGSPCRSRCRRRSTGQSTARTGQASCDGDSPVHQRESSEMIAHYFAFWGFAFRHGRGSGCMGHSKRKGKCRRAGKIPHSPALT